MARRFLVRPTTRAPIADVISEIVEEIPGGGVLPSTARITQVIATRVTMAGATRTTMGL